MEKSVLTSFSLSIFTYSHHDDFFRITCASWNMREMKNKIKRREKQKEVEKFNYGSKFLHPVVKKV